jgi:RNA polymerase sigma-70 factor (ECF subfamily)
MASELCQVFLSGLTPAVRLALPSEGVVDGWLLHSIQAAREAWPDLEVRPVDFVRYVAARITTPDAGPAVERLRMTDLYLACAVVASQRRALACFETRYFPQIDRALARLRLAPTVADDVKSSLRERLFVGTGDDQPLVSQYAGRGDLGSWVRSIAVRAALKVVRKERLVDTLDEDVRLLTPETSPELDYLKKLYASEVKEALTSALQSLTPRERNVLRQHYLDGLNIDALGALYHVHRATVARWIVSARETLLTSMRETLAERLAVPDATLDSVLQLARSELDISLSRLLRGPEP